MIGIYKIENLVNHKVYIGQSVDIKNRLRHHKQMLKNNKHFCSHLQKSWNKYGNDCFSFSVLEECLKEDLDTKEEYWLSFYGGYKSSQTYNQRGAGQESHSVSDETKEKLRKANLGKKATKRTKKKQSEALKGHPYWGRKWTDEEKERFSQSKKGTINNGIRNFDRSNPVYRQNLSNSLKGKKKTKEHAKHISEGRKGMIFSDEHKKRISLGRKGIPSIPKGSKKMEKDGIVKWAKPEEIEFFKQNGWQEYHKFCCGNYIMKEPWNKGKHLKETTKEKIRKANIGKKYSQETNMKKGLSGKNKIWINKNGTNKRVKQDELSDYLENGWVRGRRNHEDRHIH